MDHSAGAGVNGTGVARVTIATDDSWLKAEDAAHSGGDTGVMALAVRTDTAASLSGTTGDYNPLITDSIGRLWVSGTSLEDAAASSGDSGHVILAKRTDAAAVSSGTDGDYSTVNVDATGKLWVSGGFAEDAAHTTADVGVFALAVRNDTDVSGAGTDLDYQRLSTDSLGRLRVVDCPAVTVNGVTSAPVTGNLSSLTSVTDAPTAGQKLVVKQISYGGATAALYTFTCETSGAVIYTGYCPAGDQRVWTPTGKFKLATADKKLQVTASAGTAHTVTVEYYSEA